MQFLGISGSLRAHSSNTALLLAAQSLCPPNACLSIFDGVGSLPHFNADLENDKLRFPKEVGEFRGLVERAHALVISSPEYARGIPGSLKNALDWLVGSPSFPGTPVALFNASPRALHAQAALRLTLGTMSARLLDKADVTLPLLGSTMRPEAIVETHGRVIEEALHALVEEVTLERREHRD